MKNPPTHRNDADLQITIFSHDLSLCGEVTLAALVAALPR